MTLKGVGGIGRFSRSLALGAGIATARFPVSVLIVVVLSAIANAEIAGVSLFGETDLAWLLSALSTALAVSVGIRLAGESHGFRAWRLAVLPPVAAVVAGLLVWFAEQLSILAPPLVAALVLAIPLAPYARRPDDRRFWTFTLWTSVGITLAFVSVMLFVLGVSAILEMIRYLFEVGLSSDAYEHIYVTALTLVGPLFALGRIPRDFDETLHVRDDRLTAGLNLLFDWVANPLALATAAVLHLYAAKIIVLGELPKNEIGWIVSFYAVLVLALRIAVDPFIENGAVATRLFGRLWAPMLVVPLALLGYAVWLRIDAEGFTLERYYLALGASAAAIVVAAQLLKRLRGDIRFMAGVPLALLALSSWGPWGAIETVASSQTSLIAAQFTSGELAGDSAKGTLRSRIETLDEVSELDRILPLLDSVQQTEVAKRVAEKDELVSAIIDVLGVGYGVQETPPYAAAVFETSRAEPFSLEGFDTALPERSVPQGGPDKDAPLRGQPSDGSEDASVFMEGPALVVRYRGVEDRFGLFGVLDDLGLAAKGANQNNAPRLFDLESDSGRRIRLRVTWAALGMKVHLPMGLTAMVLLKNDEWVSAR